MDTIALPPSLPLLPLTNQCLLPTAFVRIQVPARARKR